MIKINLAPTAKKKRAPKRRAVKGARPGLKLPSIETTVLYIIGVVVVVVIVAVLLFIQSSQMGSLNGNITQLNVKLEELKEYKATVDSLEKRERELAALIAPIKELNKNRFFIAHILDEISSRIPEFTWLNSLNVSQSELQMKGVTASNLLVADFMNRLEESPYIHDVDLTVLEKKAVEQQEMMAFTLTANVGYDRLIERQK
ncbi:PilN domain-containing protein [candidate division WOR-3 bacterium]|jgi:Tfp pilus assembly protein PilN|nr:PilN domain-containing protein [candidate division WOR-3 bacterium]MCK4674247.1 PilN domain-containing protein [candidate division WOR-3 bacterium]